MLETILKDSAYNIAQFSKNEIDAVEEKIYQKPNGKYFMKCLIREREIQLKPEEAVRQLFIYKLLNFYGYKKSQIEVERAIHFGREVKRADIAVMEKDRPTVEYIIVEVKRPNLKDGKEQLKSYCHATGATMGVWTNGDKISFYHRKDPNYFEDIPNIPHATQKLKDILTKRWTIQDLIEKDKLATENKSLKDLILEMEDEVLANAGVDVFEEVFKLIYTKLYDEKLSANNKSRFLEFRNYGETDAELKETIQKIFDAAQKKWAGIFDKDNKLKLTPSHLAICISSLQNVKFFNSNLEIIDEAFEYLMSKSQKGEKGQYFTPRYVIDMCVRMLNPKENEFMIDTAAGSCGFPVHTIFHVGKKFGKSELFTAENKPPQFAEYVQEKIFAIDFDEKAVRVARTLNLIAGDGKTNVLWLNTLDYERWNERYEKDEDWKDIYDEGWGKLRKLRTVRKDNRNFNFDIVMANPPFAGDIKESRVLHKYELARKTNGTYQTKMGRDILFIERNLQFLKPGGRMAIVLPQGRFNNSSDKYIRDFIAERCRILAVVGLHGNVFKPHTGTKTSVLFVQKWDDTLCPRRDDYPIFFATIQKPSKDNSGNKIYVANAEGLLRDSHNHLIVDHDLFNHNGLTQDGIAEAFIEFAKKEKLSFFDSSSFDERHYNNLLEGLECTEILLSDLYDDNFEHRLDSEFILKKYLQFEKILNANKFFKIKDFAAVTDGIHESIIFDDDSNINLISAKAPKENRFDLSGTGFISKIQHQENPRTALKENDVIISTVGTIGNCAVIDSEILPANSDRHVGIVRIQKDFYPRYLSTFLLSKFGRYQTERNTTGNVQPNLFIYKIKEIKVPYISKDFQFEIEKIVKSAHKNFETADEVYKSAEKILAQALHLEDFKPGTKNTAEINFSASFGKTGRLDAEFYQPKYDYLQKFLEKLPTIKLAEAVNIFKSIEPGSDFYSNEGVPFIRVSDINKLGISAPDIKLSMQVDKSLFPCKDTILFSKDGSVGIAYKVRENLTAVTSGALLHLKVKNSSQILPDYLTLYLNSKLVQMQAERDTNGAIIQHWRIDDIKKILVPILPMETQTEIAALVEKSFALRAESERLLEMAKLAVEIAIERGENAATEYLRRGENFGN